MLHINLQFADWRPSWIFVCSLKKKVKTKTLPFDMRCRIVTYSLITDDVPSSVLSDIYCICNNEIKVKLYSVIEAHALSNSFFLHISVRQWLHSHIKGHWNFFLISLFHLGLRCNANSNLDWSVSWKATERDVPSMLFSR